MPRVSSVSFGGRGLAVLQSALQSALKPPDAVHVILGSVRDSMQPNRFVAVINFGEISTHTLDLPLHYLCRSGFSAQHIARKTRVSSWRHLPPLAWRATSFSSSNLRHS